MKTVKKQRLKLVNFKASKRDLAALKANADKYTGGNVGGWIRMVAADKRFLKSNRIRIKRAA